MPQSVAIRIFRMPLLAVAAGGPRRGGYFSTTSLSVSLAVRSLLQQRPGYPTPRLRWAPSRDAGHIVEWGEARPATWDHAALGRFYGYNDTAVAAFVRRASADATRGSKTALFGVPTPFPRGFVDHRRGPHSLLPVSTPERKSAA
jgi:hypothetical protein